MPKKKYISPKVTKFNSIDQLPAHLHSVASQMLAEQSKFVVTIDEQRRYVSVPEEFASLLGYSSGEIIGLKIDDLTPEGMVDVDAIFREFLRSGKREGFWLFTSRNGRRLLVTYRAKKENSTIEAEYVPLFLAA